MPDPHDRIPAELQLTIQALILYSIVTVALETVPKLSSEYRRFFRLSEITVVAIFTVEYLAMWFLSREPLRFPLRPISMIDLLAILPFYLQVGVDLRALRGLRLLRVFRVLRLGRYSRALQTLGEAFRRSAPELAMTGFVGVIIIVISAMALYYAEHRAQPEVYSSIPGSIWWAVVTLTTVGYGDVYPVTALGRFVAAFIILVGIGFIAVPTSILSGTFSDILREARQAGDGDPDL